jgi:hypothetical protein
VTKFKQTERQRPLRGRPYTVQEFRSKYSLDAKTAEDLFARFGPSSVELDLLMAAKRRTPSLQTITQDIAV